MPLCLIIPSKAKNPVTKGMIHPPASQTKSFLTWAKLVGSAFVKCGYLSSINVRLIENNPVETRTSSLGGFCSALNPSPVPSSTLEAPCARGAREGECRAKPRALLRPPAATFPTLCSSLTQNRPTAAVCNGDIELPPWPAQETLKPDNGWGETSWRRQPAASSHPWGAGLRAPLMAPARRAWCDPNLR